MAGNFFFSSRGIYIFFQQVLDSAQGQAGGMGGNVCVYNMNIPFLLI